jgi:hypothetical protein
LSLFQETNAFSWFETKYNLTKKIFKCIGLILILEIIFKLKLKIFLKFDI